jgi:AraC-like DNA-binding protein
MIDEIQQHYSHRLTLATLARILRRQSAYLGRLFRDEVGVTVHDYVTRARMVFGASHVRAGVKIEAVALDLGYRSKKNFYRQFKRLFGMTPEAYRRRHFALSARVSVVDEAGCTNDRPSRSVLIARPKNAPAGAPTRVPRRARARVAILLTDGRGRYVAATETAVALTGYSADELRDMPADELFPDSSGLNTKCHLQMFLPASPSLPSTTVLQTKSARRVPVHLTSVANLLGETQPGPQVPDPENVNRQTPARPVRQATATHSGPACRSHM